MGSQTNALADQLEQAAAEFAESIETYPEDKWAAAQGPEGWTVAAIAQHVSGQFPLEMEYITAAAEGREMPAYTWDDIHGMNGRRAEENTSVSKADVLKELRENATSTAAYLRKLSDEKLDRTVHLGLADADVTVQQLIEGGGLIDHVRDHLKSIQAAN